MNRTVPCPHCHGKGKLAVERDRIHPGWPRGWKDCGLCHGRGWLPDPDDEPQAA